MPESPEIEALQISNAPVPIGKAAQIFFPHGGVTVSTLRQAIRMGELRCEMIGRGYCVTFADVQNWREMCRKAALDRVLQSGPKTRTGSGMSHEERMKTAQAALAALLAEPAKKVNSRAR